MSDETLYSIDAEAKISSEFLWLFLRELAWPQTLTSARSTRTFGAMANLGPIRGQTFEKFYVRTRPLLCSLSPSLSIQIISLNLTLRNIFQRHEIFARNIRPLLCRHCDSPIWAASLLFPLEPTLPSSSSSSSSSHCRDHDSTRVVVTYAAPFYTSTWLL